MNEPLIASGRPSRRGFLQLLGAGGAALALAGCSSGIDLAGKDVKGRPTGLTGGPPGPGSFATGRYGGRVVTGWSSEANSYDAALGYDLQSWEAISCLLYSPLYQYAGEYGGPKPSAALAMPTVSDGGTTYTITLRPDVRFHNGRRVVAQDYVYAWTRLLDPKLESWASSYLLGIDGAEKVNAGKAKVLTGLTALDDRTLQVRLNAPNIMFLTTLCLPFTAAVPREAVDKLGKHFSHTPVGNGPFKIVKYDSTAQRAIFARNKDFFWHGVPLLDQVEYRWGIDPSLQFLQLQKGNLDILGEGLSVGDAARVQAKDSLRDNFLVPVSVNALSYIAPNYTSPALRDVRVRQALNWATDREQLAKFMHGTSQPWGSAFPAHEADYTRTAQPYGYDPQRAKALLGQAGVETLELEFINGGDDVWPLLSQVLQQQWAQIGVRLKLSTMSSAAFDAAISKRHGDLFGTDWYQVQPSALDLVDANFVTDGSSNYNGYSNKEVDALVNKAQAALTVSSSNAILSQVETLLTEDAAAIFVGNLSFLAARAPRVHNYHMRGETGSYYDRMWV
jgi:peptide/nickel transport system substrate-binding protein